MAVRNTGLIERFYVDRIGCFLRLKETGATPENSPKDGYYRILLTHENYQSLSSLAMLAADSRRRLTVRTAATITPDEHAEVSYLVLDYPEVSIPVPGGYSSSGSGGSRDPRDIPDLDLGRGRHPR